MTHRDALWVKEYLITAMKNKVKRIAVVVFAAVGLSSCAVYDYPMYTSGSVSMAGRGWSSSVAWTDARYDVNGFPIYGYSYGRPVYGYTSSGVAVFSFTALTSSCCVPSWGPAHWYCGHWHYPRHIHRVSVPPRYPAWHRPGRHPVAKPLPGLRPRPGKPHLPAAGLRPGQPPRPVPGKPAGIHRPVKPFPVVNRPVHNRPGVSSPIVNGPAGHRPAIKRPVHHRPVVNRPVQPRPTLSRPAVNRPVHHRPAAQRPVMGGARPAAGHSVNRPVSHRVPAMRGYGGSRHPHGGAGHRR